MFGFLYSWFVILLAYESAVQKNLGLSTASCSQHLKYLPEKSTLGPQLGGWPVSGEPKRRLRDYPGGKAKSSRVWHVSSFDFVTDFVMGIWKGFVCYDSFRRQTGFMIQSHETSPEKCQQATEQATKCVKTWNEGEMETRNSQALQFGMKVRFASPHVMARGRGRLLLGPRLDHQNHRVTSGETQP